MNKLKLIPMDLKKDIPEIETWESKFCNNHEFDSIKKFILEGNTYYGLYEVIENNYELVPIGDDERKFCFAIKDDDTIAGFVIAQMYDISRKHPTLFLQYLVLNPDYQHCGFGSQIMQDLIYNGKEYFGHNPVKVHSNINKTNFSSLRLYKKFGFRFREISEKYVEACRNVKTLEHEKI